MRKFIPVAQICAFFIPLFEELFRGPLNVRNNRFATTHRSFPSLFADILICSGGTLALGQNGDNGAWPIAQNGQHERV